MKSNDVILFRSGAARKLVGAEPAELSGERPLKMARAWSRIQQKGLERRGDDKSPRKGAWSGSRMTQFEIWGSSD